MHGLAFLIRSFAAISALAVSTVTATAADTYLVEVLVFENPGGMDSREYFPTMQNPAPTEAASAPSSVRYSGAGLSALASVLSKNAGYRVLASTGWQQALADRASAPAVPVAPPGAGRVLPEVNGTLRVYESAPLLFLETDLSFNPAGVTEIFRLREKRRVKLNELHYFDHPRFGALVRVSRVPQG